MDLIEHFWVVKIIKMWRLIAVGRIGGDQGLRWEADVREDVGGIRIRNFTEMTLGEEAQK